MLKVTKYQILSKREPDELEKVIDLHIESGWQPLGGLVTVQRNGELFFCQAIGYVEETKKR